ncbi:MAG: hypothetical protein ACFFCZ_06170 [Promethearchaeota archaeon]
MVCKICKSKHKDETIFSIEICRDCARIAQTKNIQRTLKNREFKEDELLVSMLMVDGYEGTLPSSVAEHLEYFLVLSKILFTKENARYFLYLGVKQRKIDPKSVLTILLLARQAFLIDKDKKDIFLERAQTRFAFLIAQLVAEDLLVSAAIREGLMRVQQVNENKFVYEYLKARFGRSSPRNTVKMFGAMISEDLSTQPEFKTALSQLLRRL